jgi:hypothetical protein
MPTTASNRPRMTRFFLITSINDGPLVPAFGDQFLGAAT